MNRLEWFISTILLGLAPTMLKAVIILLMKDKDWSLVINSIEFATFGIIVSVTSLNELIRKKQSKSSNWYLLRSSLAALSLVLLSIFLAFASASDFQDDVSIFDANALIYATIILSISSGVLSYSIYQPTTK